MAKVMISIPDELLDRVDAYARRQQTTRSGLLRVLAERELATDADVRRRRISELLDAPGSFDGRATEHIREERSSR
jgi:metal-responsive CopG/Arc/MetJ family transcriptional regulator